MKEYTYQIGDKFEVCGFYYNSNRRFKTIRTDNVRYAFGINLWKGSIWLIRDNKKSILKRVNW